MIQKNRFKKGFVCVTLLGGLISQQRAQHFLHIAAMWRHSMQLSLYEQQCLNCCRGYSTQLKLLHGLARLSYVTFPRCTFVSPDLGSLNSVNTSPLTAWMRESGDRMTTNDTIKRPKQAPRLKCSATMSRCDIKYWFTKYSTVILC